MNKLAKWHVFSDSITYSKLEKEYRNRDCIKRKWRQDWDMNEILWYLTYNHVFSTLTSIINNNTHNIIITIMHRKEKKIQQKIQQ